MREVSVLMTENLYIYCSPAAYGFLLQWTTVSLLISLFCAYFKQLIIFCSVLVYSIANLCHPFLSICLIFFTY